MNKNTFNRRVNKLKFLKRNLKEYEYIIECDKIHRSVAFPTYQKFIQDARTEIGYSDSTVDVDIFRSFSRIYEQLKPATK